MKSQRRSFRTIVWVSSAIALSLGAFTAAYYFANTSTSGLISGANYTLTPAIPAGYTSSTPASLTFTWSASSVFGNFALN